MKDIMDDVHDIEDEIDDAKKYAMKAIACKEAGKPRAETYYRLASDEITHANLIHGMVTADIDAYRKEHGDAPEPMKQVYDVLHKEAICKMATVKGLLSLYKGDK